MPPPVTPPSRAYTWPAALNACWLLLLLLAGKGEGNASFISLVVVLASGANILGLLLALFRRKWLVAGWYGLALVVVLGFGALALSLVETPLYQEE